MKSGSDRPTEIAVPTIREPQVDYTDLLNRSRLTRGRARVVIEREIAKRQEFANKKTDEVLNGWE